MKSLVLAQWIVAIIASHPVQFLLRLNAFFNCSCGIGSSSCSCYMIIRKRKLKIVFQLFTLWNLICVCCRCDKCEMWNVRCDCSNWILLAQEHKPAAAAAAAVDHCVDHSNFRANRHQLVVVLSGCHNLRWAEQHNATNVYRRPTWLDNVVNVDSHLDIASSDYTIYPMQHCRLHPHCKVLQINSKQNETKQRKRQIKIDWHRVIHQKSNKNKDSRCFWHPSTFSGQSQLWAFSL